MACNAITLLPSEIIVYILEDKLLNFVDVVNFGTTCKHFNKLVNHRNELWKKKFFQRWPDLKEVYQTSRTLEDQCFTWKEEAEASMKSRKELLHHLSLMSSKYFRKQEVSNIALKEYDPLFHPEQGAHPLAYYFLTDELHSIISCPAIISNLTHRYYALKVIRYLKQYYLKDEWKKFLSLPPKEQTLERGATIVAQWSQPERYVTYSSISESLDNIAEQTKELLKERYPNHSIFFTPPEQFTYWKNNILGDNQWNITETKQVTEALCEVLFKKLGFYGNSEMYYSSVNSFIDRVLEDKRGIPITLAIVFESVARRLGIHCEPVSFPSHFLLRWKETYGPDSQDTENFYIDVFNGGEFLTKRHCPRIGGVSRCPIEKYNVHEAASAVDVVKRMANNLEIAARQHTHINGRSARLQSALELRYMVQPSDGNIIMQLGRIYILQQMDLTELVKTMEDMHQEQDAASRAHMAHLYQAVEEAQSEMQRERSQTECNQPRIRSPAVKYAIGLIMKHKILGYMCVITEWDTLYKSQRRKNETNVGELIEGVEQPFYDVFVDNGSNHYVAQENLMIAPNPEWIDHYSIGRHFYKFNCTHYVPNEEKMKDYPQDDEELRVQILAEHAQRGNLYKTD